MSRLHVLVISAGSQTGAWLAARLDPRRFRVRTARPGPGLIQAARKDAWPHVAVLDGVHARPGVAQMEVALLKDQNPGVRIIALSGEPSPRDAEVVEQGIFCYLGGCSLEELLRVIESAAREPATNPTAEEIQPGPRGVT
jgi:hypothetical protein